jgi:hypothetical protein
MVVGVSEYGFGMIGFSAEPRAIVQPDTVAGGPPVPLQRTAVDLRPREATTTIRRNITVLATVDSTKEKSGHLDDFRIEKIL